MYWSQTESSKWSLDGLSFHPRPPFKQRTALQPSESATASGEVSCMYSTVATSPPAPRKAAAGVSHARSSAMECGAAAYTCGYHTFSASSTPGGYFSRLEYSSARASIAGLAAPYVPPPSTEWPGRGLPRAHAWLGLGSRFGFGFAGSGSGLGSGSGSDSGSAACSRLHGPWLLLAAPGCRGIEGLPP
eukprot:scaffold19109_cov75-Phaeocystis_antarctica.AAC.1